MNSLLRGHGAFTTTTEEETRRCHRASSSFRLPSLHLSVFLHLLGQLSCCGSGSQKLNTKPLA